MRCFRGGKEGLSCLMIQNLLGIVEVCWTINRAFPCAGLNFGLYSGWFSLFAHSFSVCEVSLSSFANLLLSPGYTQSTGFSDHFVAVPRIESAFLTTDG